VMPKTKLNKMAMYPDLWNKMNVSAAKAPFKFEKITDMMLNLGKAIGCVHEMAFDKSTNNKPKTYLNCLDILQHANIKNGNTITHTLLATIEYYMHVAILFNEILMNKEIRLDEKTIDECKELAYGLMQYFEDWKMETDDLLTGSNNQAKRQQINKCFMSMVTYNDLCICATGFFLYA